MKPIDLLLTEASSFISSEFNLQLQQSQFKPYSPKNWQKFCQANSFDADSSGLYVPQPYSAYVNIESPFLASNIFHELFGHGLFCEHSLIGQRLVENAQKGNDTNSFLYDEINPHIQPLGLAKQNIGNYEGFAVWMEALLCEAMDERGLWERKKEGMLPFYRTLYEYFQDAKQKLSKFGFMSQLGFPKYYSSEDVVDVLRHLYGVDKFANIDLIILYGSKKPYSDIDLCLVSSEPSAQHYNGWLDIAELNREDFVYRLENLDIALTDAMFSGELIYGDENSFVRHKQKVLDAPITRGMVEYNIGKAQSQRDYLPHYEQNTRLRDLCLSYIDSYSQNAELLKEGKKPLTLESVNHTSQEIGE